MSVVQQQQQQQQEQQQSPQGMSPSNFLNGTSNIAIKNERTQSLINTQRLLHSNNSSMMSIQQLNVQNNNSNFHNNTQNLLSPHIKKELNVANRRLDLGSMIEELTAILGKENWIKYAQITSRFILGKLSRNELVNELDILFNENKDDKLNHHRLIRLHNQLLLGIFTNSLRDSPMGNADRSWGFQNGNTNNNSNKIMKKVNKHNSQIETYKKIVMSLPNSDRKRLKAITKEAGKRGFIYCSVLQGRLNNVPKIPIVTNPETLKRVKNNNLKTPLEWSQDIVNGFNAPLSTDNYALPDTDSLYLKMTGISREHGLVGGVDANSVELLSLALDSYLKSIIEFGIDSIRYRTKKYSEFYDLNDDAIYVPVTDITLNEANNFDNRTNSNMNDTQTEVQEIDRNPKISLTNEDIYNALNIFPNLVEPTSGAIHNLSTNALYNDDDLVVMKSSIDDLPEFLNERPISTPLDDRNIGTREELNWLIKDILTEER